MKKAFRPRISPGLVLTMGLALFNLGIFGVLLLTGNGLDRQVKEQFEVQVFLQKGLSAEQANAAGKLIRQTGFVAQDESGRLCLEFVSKKQAGDKFIKETGEDFYQFLGENPLRDAFHFKVKEQYINRASLQGLRTKLSGIPGVFEVQYLEYLADALEQNLNKIALVFLLSTGILLLTLYWLIRAAIRSSLHSGRFFIRSMELVGASAWFIRRPYVMSIGIGGMLGGLLACAGTLGCVGFLQNQFPDLSDALPITEAVLLAGLLIPTGFLLGFLPALGGIRAYQSRKLGELHSY